MSAWRCRRGLASALWAAVAGFGLLQPTQAHLMVEQRGTLNFVGSGGFVVMSVPVDALEGVDDDGDGRLSRTELSAHTSTIEAQLLRGLQLVDDAGPRPLEGLMLNLSLDDGASTAPAAHLVVLGRFALVDGSAQALSRLRLRFSLFGSSPATQQQTITVTRGSEAQKLVLTPASGAAALFPSTWAVLRDNIALGAAHVLSGPDHLLFLLVVLATGWGWRAAALALSCFTAGHAITLAGVALGGLSAPANIVEPAIAATIVGMAGFDRWSNARSRPLAPGWRLAMVFACALIHGLGLAGALSSLGLDPAHRLLSLVGFNGGVELAQLGVALAAGVLVSGLRRWRGPAVLAVATRLASYSAMFAGVIWLVERSVQAH